MNGMYSINSLLTIKSNVMGSHPKMEMNMNKMNFNTNFEELFQNLL